MNQFESTNFSNALANIKGVLVKPTVSLCHHCGQHIPAYTYHTNNQYWLVKSCNIHGISHHLIERDYEFISSLQYNDSFYSKHGVVVEIKNRGIGEIVNSIKSWYDPKLGLVLTELSSLSQYDLINLITQLTINFDEQGLVCITDGDIFSDNDFLLKCIDVRLDKVGIELANSYPKEKQIQAIENFNNSGIFIGYIGYTVSDDNHLEDILAYSTNSDWNPYMFRIRFQNQNSLYMSDIYQLVKTWCECNNKQFKLVVGDNNMYHVMVSINGQYFRLIKWCDKTNIVMEELRMGPWCSIIPSSLTNLLHQTMQKGICREQETLETAPIRYQYQGSLDTNLLDFTKLY